VIAESIERLSEERKVTHAFLMAKLERKQWDDVAKASMDMKTIEGKLAILSTLKMPVDTLLIQNESFRVELDKLKGKEAPKDDSEAEAKH